MKNSIISHCFLWLCVVVLTASAEDTRLYSGEIQIPTIGPLKMTLGVSETDEGTFLLLTVLAQGAKVQCPILAMNGTLDVQVSSRQNLPAIEKTMTQSVGKLTIVELEGLNHLFQPATTGAVAEYGQIETTFDPAALEIMNDWILEVSYD